MIIRKYIDFDFSQVELISKQSFSQTPFHVDDFFTHQQANQIVWEQWTLPAIESVKKYCFVAELHGEITGFLIYGGYKPLREILNKKMASIILLAVKEDFRNSSFKVGTKLVEYALRLFKQNDVKLVTVGTDLPNQAALHVYEKNNFQRILQWSTFRFYSEVKATEATDLFQKEITLPNDLPLQYLHPITFLHDPLFSELEKNEIRKVYDKTVEENIKKGMLILWHDKEKNTYVVIEKEKKLSDIVQKDVFRINRVLSQEKESFPLFIPKFCQFFSSTYPNSMLECYVPSFDENCISILIASEFKNIHTSVSLHAWL